MTEQRVITLKDGRRVFDHAGEHKVGGRIMLAVTQGEEYQHHKIVPAGPRCTCGRSIHQHLGHWRHARRQMRPL